MTGAGTIWNVWRSPRALLVRFWIGIILLLIITLVGVCLTAVLVIIIGASSSASSGTPSTAPELTSTIGASAVASAATAATDSRHLGSIGRGLRLGSRSYHSGDWSFMATISLPNFVSEFEDFGIRIMVEFLLCQVRQYLRT